MNIVYVNLVPLEIDNEQIYSFLSELVDDVLRLPQGSIPIKNAEDLFPGVNSYFEKILSFHCAERREGIAGVDVFLKTLNNYPSFDSILDSVKEQKLYLGEDESIYGILEEGYKKQFFLKSSKIVVISGDKYYIPYPNGIACGNVCINRCLKQYSIWHETAHLFGADDHYDKNHKTHTTTCADEKCFMQYNALEGEHFCSKALSEIGVFVAQQQICQEEPPENILCVADGRKNSILIPGTYGN